MSFLDKFERKFGKHPIPNLTRYIIGIYILGYILEALSRSTGVNLLEYIALNPYYIVHGQIWRLVTWILIPPSSFSILTIIMLIFYYQIGTALENVWGDFLYNFYIFFGLLMTVIGSFILYLIVPGLYQTAAAVGSSAALHSTYYVSISIFLGFAMTFPDQQVLLMFLIPIKMKYLGWVEIAYFIYEIAASSIKIVPLVNIICALSATILFFFMTRGKNFFGNRRNRKRQRQFRDAMSGRKAYGSSYGARRSSGSGHTRMRGSNASDGRIAKHRCAVCGRTELDDPNLEFRFCSKCNGNYEYCQDHLFNHKHVQ